VKINKNDIFKFAPINKYTFKNLILSQIRFNPPDSMNDQLEGLIKIKNVDFKPSTKAIKHFVKSNNLEYYYNKPIQEIKKKGFLKIYMENWFRQQRNLFGICCFSTNPYESLMWSHYAEKHQGICLIYNKEELSASLRNTDFWFDCREINYKNRPVLELEELENKVTSRSDLPLITFKNSNWRYEKEIRFFIQCKPGTKYRGSTISIYPSALKGIIYGSDMDEDDKDSISFILRNDPGYQDVLEYNANLDFETGKIFFTKD
jgi:hypothetical protein